MIIRDIRLHDSVVEILRYEPMDDTTLVVVRSLCEILLGERIDVLEWARPDSGDPVVRVRFDSEEDFMLFYMRHG